VNNFKETETEEDRSLPVSARSSFKYKSNKGYYLYYIILPKFEISAKLLRKGQMSVVGNKQLIIFAHHFLNKDSPKSQSFS